MSFPYGATISKPKYVDDKSVKISNVHTEVYVDWDKNEVYVDYLYENIQNFIPIGAQFVQIIPRALYDSLAPRYVGGQQVVAKFNHVYKYGTTGDGGDEGVSLYASNFTIGNRADDFKYTADSSGDRAAFRLQRPNDNRYIYTHPWETITALQKADQGGVPQAVDLRGDRGRYLAHSTSFGPLENHTTYYIDPVKFRQNFKDIDDLSIESFFVVNARDEGPGILANSDSSSTPSYSKAITNSPTVDEIYDDAKAITGKTGYSNGNQNVFIEAKNYKDDPTKVKFTKDHVQGVNADGSFNLIPGTFDGVFENMEKDDKLTFETIYQYENHFKSAPTVKKVKSRIHFLDYETDPENPDKRVEKVVEVPASTLFRGQEGYKETGLGNKMPTNPTKEGYIFKGWATKAISAQDYTAQEDGNDKVTTLSNINQWKEDKAYKFDGTSPINKSYVVYPVWEEETKEFTIVLHSNDGTNRTKEIKVNYGENLPSLTELESKALTQEQYAAIANGAYSEKSILPNAYQVDDKDVGIFGERDKFNFVGWSTMDNNGGEMIENLYSNKAMLAAEGEGNNRKFYLSTVKTSGQDIGQASASKEFKEVEIKNDEIHLYAAWKPYFHMTVNKTWYDASGETYKQAYVNDILSAIAHGQQVPIKDENGNTTGSIDAPVAMPGLARNVHVGLLYRTAVTEANKPTVTGDANYYIVDGSIKELPTTTNKAEWDLPSYDGYGKRLSYIAVEFKDKATADAAFDRFNQKWNNIWTDVGNNLADISEWTNKTIAKVQNVELNNSDGTGIDAFTSATVRKLEEDNKPITERETNKSTVGSKPTYTTSLYNVKSSMGYPNFKKIFDGETEVHLIPSDDERVKVVSFDLPSEFEPIYFKRQDNGTWTRVVTKSDNTGWDSYDRADKDKYTFAPENTNTNDPSWTLKYNLEKYPKLKNFALKTGDVVKAKYYGDTPVINSIWSQQTVENKPVTPTLNGLEQVAKETIDGKEYVVIRAVKPTADLGQFKEDATLTLIHHGKATEGELADGEAYKDTDGKNITATEKDGYYYFKVPVENIKHEDKVGVHGHQDSFVDSRSTLPLTVDLQGPVITAENQTVFKDEDVDLAKAVSTDEAAKLENGALPDGLSLKQKENAELGTEWKLEGKADANGDTTVKLTATDKFGNVSEKTDWKITVVDRPETDSIDSFGKDNAKQIPNNHDGEFRNITHRIEIKKVIPGSTIKVYLRDPSDSQLGVQREFKVPADHSGSFILDIPENLGKNILDAKLYLTQTEEGKKESKATAVDMDVIPPTAPTIEVKPGEEKLTLSGITGDTTEIHLRVAGKDYKLEKTTAGTTWAFVKPDGDRTSVNIEGGSVSIDLIGKLSPKDPVKLVAVDAMINPSGAQKTVPQFEQPAAPTITAENKDNATVVSGKTNYPGELIKIYTVKTVTDPDTQEESKEYTLVEKVFADPNGNYKVTFGKDKFKPGTVFAASVTVNGIESIRSEATLYENTDVIPFDPDDPNKPVNPDDDPNNPNPPEKPEDRKYVTVTLDANGGKFAPGTKSSFYVKKTHVLTTNEFEDAKLHLQAPIDKTFDKWTEDQEGKTAYAEKAFTEDATIYASYKADGNIIPFDPEDPNKPDKPDKDKYVTVTLDANGGSFAEGTKSAFYVKKEYTVTTNDFAIAERGLKAPEGKAFTAWYLEKDGKTPFPVEGKKFDADASVFAAYKEDRDIIPVTPGGDGTLPDVPKGYVRVKLEKDDASVEFLAPDAKTYYDVKIAAKVRYADVTNQVTAKEKAGYKDLKWYEKDQDKLTLADSAKVITENVTLYAKAVNDKDIIPVEPGKEDDTKTPEGYVRVKLSHDDTVAFTDNIATSYDVKADGSIRYADVYNKVGAHPVDGYKDMKWYQGEKAVTGTELVKTAVELTAKASNSKNIIPVEPGKEDDPTTIPEGYVRVKFVKDTGLKEITGTVAYDIKADGSVRYKDLIDEVTGVQSKTTFTYEDGYRQPPIFKIGEADLVLTAYPQTNTEIKVSATQKDAGKYNPEGVIQDVKKDETPKAENSIGNKEELPEGTKYEFVDDQGNKTTPDTSTIGEKDVTVKVTYPDGSSETVDTKINIVPKEDIIDVTDPDNTPVPKGYIRVKFMDDETVAYGENVIRACDIRESALATVKYSSLWTRTTVNPAKDYRKPISWYLGQSEDAITVDRLVKDDVDANTKILEITPKATQTDASKYDPKGQDLKVTQGSTIEAKDFIKNKEDMPIGTGYEFVDDNGEPVTPDTNKLGKQDLKIKVTFPDKSTKIVPASMDVVPKDNIVKVDDPDNTPVPTGYVRVTLVNDKTSVKTYKEVYDVKVEAKIKYGDVLLRAASVQPNDKYTEPITWKMNGNPVDRLATISDTSTLTAFAKLKDSEAYEPKVQDQTVKQGETPKAEDSIKNKEDLPEGTKYEFVDPTTGDPTTPDTSKPGTQKPNVKVTYPDGSSEVVGPTTITVVPDKDIIPVKPGEEDTTTTPEGYVRVTLTKDDTSVDFKAGAVTSYDVKADGTVLYSQVVAEVGASAKAGYKDLKWYKDNSEVSLLDKVTGTEAITLNAKAVNDKDIIPVTPGEEGTTETPEGYVRVKLTHDTTVTFKDGVATSYDVNANGTVRYADVYAKVEAKPADGYKDLKWYKDNTAVSGNERVTEAITLNAKAVNDKDIIPVTPGEEGNTETPEGYVRVKLTHDTTVTFKDGVATSYDVKADGSIRYSDVYTKVNAQPIQGYKDVTWSKDNRTVTGLEKVEGTEAITLTASAVHSDSIIPVKPGEEDSTVTPNGYIRVTLTKDDTSVKFTAPDAPTSYDVKADGTVLLADVYAKVQAVPVEGYKDLTWYKGDEAVKITEKVSGKTPITLEAKAVKDITDGIIPVPNPDENPNPPAGYVRVTIVKGDGINKLIGIKTYDVKADKSVRYSDIVAKIQLDGGNASEGTVVTLAGGYREPLVFTVAGNKVDITDYPTRATTIVVGATEKDSNKYTPEVQEQTVNQGETPDPADSIANKDELPDGTKYEFVDDQGQSTKPDTDTPGEKDVKIKVTYPDGSEETVETKITVEKNKPGKPQVDPIKEGDGTVKVEVPTDGDKVIVELPDGTKVEATKDPDTGKWTATETDPDTGKPKTDPDTGDPIVKPVEVNDEGKLEIPVDPDKVKPGEDPVKVTVEDSESGKTSDPTEVPIVAIPKQLEQIRLGVANLYDGRTGIAVSTNPIEATIVVYKDGEEVGNSTTNALGEVTIVLTKEMVKGEKYTIKASKDGYLPNEIIMTVK